MLELIDARPDVNVQESEYQRLLGYPTPHVLEGRARELAEQTRDWYASHGRPWVYARQTGDLQLGDELRVDGAGLTSKQLREQLNAAQAHSAMVVAVSAGMECEERARQLWEEGKPDEYFFMEMYGSAVVEHLITTIGGRICAWAEPKGMAVLPHCSPGYSGWDISDQNRLWNLIRRSDSRRFPGTIQVLDTGMLCPKKSLLAFFGITRHLEKMRAFRHLVPCENCALPSCQYRRAPYQHALPLVEEVNRLETVEAGASLLKPGNGSCLNHSANYTVNRRALQKWSRDRLQLTPLKDHSVEACFRYEGTTCVNMGRPLEFHYHVRIGSPADDYRIIDASCVPAPGDTGHQSMCEYLNNAGVLMNSIAREKPLLGQPLNDVFAWQRTFNPSGCYCDADRRMHKWGLVLEVIHYALVQREKAAANGDQTTISA
jgi:hypothetical protein